MNILYLLKCLKTTQLSELVANIDLPLLDINLALWDAEAAGEVKINRKKDKIQALKDAEPSRDEELANKILRTVQYHAAQEINITVGKLTSWVKNQAMEHNYPYHEYVMALQYLIDTGQIIEEEVSVPKIKGRPFHRFVFLCLEGNDNENWNARQVNKWIANWESNK